MTGAATGSLLDRLTRDGAAADLGPDPAEPDAAADAAPGGAAAAAGAADAARLVAAVRRAAAAMPDEAAACVAWDEAGAAHTPETLDVALAELTGWRFLGFTRAAAKRRIRDAARLAMQRTRSVGALQLAAAFVGELGDEDDVAALERVAVHPRLTLHGATALSNLRPWQARLALLRLLTTTTGDARVLVIDRLLPHVGQPAVRLALVRDALRGLAPEHAHEVARDIASACRAKDLADDKGVADDVREGARAVLAAAEDAANA